MRGVYGLPYDHPGRSTEEYATILARALRGEQADLDGTDWTARSAGWVAVPRTRSRCCSPRSARGFCGWPARSLTARSRSWPRHATSRPTSHPASRPPLPPPAGRARSHAVNQRLRRRRLAFGERQTRTASPDAASPCLLTDTPHISTS